MTARHLSRIDRELLRQLLDPDYVPSIPFDQPVERAAVASIMREGERGAEMLFIQRATRSGDPWSGHMAFPGGRTDRNDPSPRATAIRETVEELALELTDEHHVGTVGELDGGRATNRLVLVSAHGFWIEGERPQLEANYEVAEALWVPLDELANPGRYIDYYYPPAGVTFPGIQLDRADQVIWGLTLRFLSDFFARLRHPFII